MTLQAKLSIIATTLFSTTALTATAACLMLAANPAYAKDKDKDHHDRKDEIKLLALKSSDVSLQDLVTKFESTYSGVVTDVELDHEDDVLVFEIKAIDLEKGVKHEASYSIKGGVPVKYHEESLTVLGFNKLDDHHITALEAMKGAQAISLKQAIAMAQSNSDAYIESIELEYKRGVSYYEVELLSASGEQKLLIDAQSGEAVPSLRH